MANIFDIPRSQGLRFVNLTKEGLPQTYDNRLIADLVYPNTVIGENYQKYEQLDYIRLHYRTDYVQYNIYLVDENRNAVNVTSNQVVVHPADSKDRVYYDLDIDITNLNGCYYVCVAIYQNGSPVQDFQSEPFYVSESVPYSNWIEWYGNDNTYDDMMHWDSDNRQGVRIVSEMGRAEFSQSKNTYESTDYVPETLKAKPNKVRILNVEKDYEYLIERINLGLNHNEFYVNNVRYNNDEPVSIEAMGRLLQYKSSIKLIESDYEDGESEVLTGEIPEVPDTLRTTGTTTRSTGTAFRKTNN